MLFAAFVARSPLEDRVKPVAAVVDRPQGQLVGDGPRWNVDLEGDRGSVSVGAAESAFVSG
jgi:hypothetical protein